MCEIIQAAPLCLNLFATMLTVARQPYRITKFLTTLQKYRFRTVTQVKLKNKRR